MPMKQWDPGLSPRQPHSIAAEQDKGSLRITIKLTRFSFIRLLSSKWEDGKKRACWCGLWGLVKLTLDWGGVVGRKLNFP